MGNHICNLLEEKPHYRPKVSTAFFLVSQSVPYPNPTNRNYVVPIIKGSKKREQKPHEILSTSQSDEEIITPIQH